MTSPTAPRTATDLRAAPAHVRQDAALVARIYRAQRELDRWERNRLARGNARRVVRSWLFQNKEA